MGVEGPLKGPTQSSSAHAEEEVGGLEEAGPPRSTVHHLPAELGNGSCNCQQLGTVAGQSDLSPPYLVASKTDGPLASTTVRYCLTVSRYFIDSEDSSSIHRCFCCSKCFADMELGRVSAVILSCSVFSTLVHIALRITLVLFPTLAGGVRN